MAFDREDTQFLVVTHRKGTMEAADRLHGVTLHENGVIYLTTDGGISWQQKVSGTQNDLFSIASSSSSKLIAVGRLEPTLMTIKAK